MSGLIALAAVLFATGELDLDAFVSAEARVGQAPLLTETTPRGAVAGLVTPGLSLEVRQHDLQLRLSYGPRIFWREPNETSSLKPLILHVANAEATDQLSRRTRLIARATASVGEADYSTVAQLFGPNQMALPSVVSFLSTGGGVTGETALTSRWGVAGTLGAVYRRPLGSEADVPPTAGNFALARQLTLQAQPSSAYAVTRLDDASAASPLVYTWSSLGFELLTVSPQLGWRRRLSRRYTVRLAAGLTYARVLSTAPLTVEGTVFAPPSILPIGGAELEGRFLPGGRGILTSAVGLSVDYFVDPNVGTALSRGVASARVSWSLPRDWAVGFDSSFATSLTTEPQAGFPIDETSAAASLLAQRPLSDQTLAEVGFRWANRGGGRPLADGNFGFHQRQIWFYVSFTATTAHVRRIASTTAGHQVTSSNPANPTNPADWSNPERPDSSAAPTNPFEPNAEPLDRRAADPSAPLDPSAPTRMKTDEQDR